MQRGSAARWRRRGALAAAWASRRADLVRVRVRVGVRVRVRVGVRVGVRVRVSVRVWVRVRVRVAAGGRTREGVQ